MIETNENSLKQPSPLKVVDSFATDGAIIEQPICNICDDTGRAKVICRPLDEEIPQFVPCKCEKGKKTIEQPIIEMPEMCENTKLIVKACKQVIISANDYENDVMTTPITVVQACEQLNCVFEKLKEKAAQGMVKMGFKTEQPNSNAMIFEQVNGSIKVALELLGELEVKGTAEDERKQGCIWTLKGWQDNNLKHLQKAFE